MRYTSLVLTSLLATFHVCHGKPIPTLDDPPYSEAESISTTSAETTTLTEETTSPSLYPTDTGDFPSHFPETTTATKVVESVTVSITASEAQSAEVPATTEEHSATTEEHKPIETPATTTSEEDAAPSDHEAPSDDADSSDDEASLDDEAPSEHDASSDHEASPENDAEAPSDDADSSDDEASSDEEAPSEHDTSSDHEASPENDASSDYEAPSDNDTSSDRDAASDHDASSDNEDEAPPADSSPKPQDQDRPCGRFDPWTIHSLSRYCDDADTVCDWSFTIDTNCPSLAPTPCSFSIKSLGPGLPASRSPKPEKGEDEFCGPYEVHSSWSGQFGPGEGFTTLSVIDDGNKLVAYPAYRDDLFGKDEATVPDVDVAVYALG